MIKNRVRPFSPPAPFLEILEPRIAPAVFTVNSTSDDLTPDDNLTTLREAILAANDLGKGKHTIKFDPTVFVQESTITLDDSLGAIPITSNLTISGLGLDRVTVSGGESVRIFTINDTKPTASTVSLSGLTLRSGAAALGGAIYSTESLILNNVVVAGSTAQLQGGGIYLDTPGTFTASNSQFTDNLSFSSGGLYLKAGKVSLTNVEVTNNRADDRGAGMEVRITGAKGAFSMVGSAVMGNTLSSSATGEGGGIWLGKEGPGGLQASIKTSVIQGNTAGTNGVGGGLAFFDNASADGAVRLTIEKTQINGNRAADVAGVYVHGESGGSLTYLTLKDSGITNNISVGAFQIPGRGGALGLDGVDVAMVDKSLMLRNQASDLGGAIYSENSGLIMKATTLAGNSTSGQGGAIFLQGGDTEILSSTLSGNEATSHGGAIATIDGWLSVGKSTLEGNSGSSGGAVFLQTAGSVMISGSFFTGNEAQSGGAILAKAENLTDDPFSLDLSIDKNQFVGNSVQNSGGAITLQFRAESVALLSGNSFTGNSSGSGGGAIHFLSGDPTTASVNVLKSTFRQNATTGAGGAVFMSGNGDLDVIVSDSTFTQNYASSGGGAVAKTDTGGDLQINGSTISGNASVSPGGGLANQSPDSSTIDLFKTSVFENASPASDNLHPNVFGEVNGFVPIIPKALKGTHVVTNLNDSGEGSLRQAILDANGTGKAAAIVFNPSLAGLIILESDLPAIEVPLNLLGSGVDRIAISGENSYQILTFNAPDSTSRNTVSGVTFSKGTNPDGVTGGGAINNAGAEAITVNRSVFLDNNGWNGGAIYGEQLSTGTLLSIQNSLFAGNSANESGGAVRNVGAATVSNSFFYINNAASGGAMDLTVDYLSNLLVTGSSFLNNNAATGGGVNLLQLDHFGKAVIDKSVFNANYATASGGGLSLLHSNLSSLGSTTTLSGLTVANNSGVVGGGIHIAGTQPASLSVGSVTFTGGKIFNNEAPGATPNDGEGAGIFVEGKMRLNLSKAVLAGNEARAQAGGLGADDGAAIGLNDVKFFGNVAGKNGGGLGLSDNSAANLAKALVYGNRAGENGGGLYANSSTVVDNATRYIGNLATDGAGAFLGQGAGPEDPVAKGTFTKSFFSGNEALSNGGALRADSAQLSLNGATVQANRIATFDPFFNAGGGLSISQTHADSSTLITKTVISANLGLMYAGGVFLDTTGGTSHVISKSTIRDNYAFRSGGGLYLAGSIGQSITQTKILENGAGFVNGSNGGGVYFAGSALALSGSSITHNSASWGGGFYGPINNPGINKNSIVGNSAATQPNIAP